MIIDPYVFPGTTVLKNLFDLREADKLAAMERQLTLTRAEEICPKGKFDLPHLQAIHKHLFQDIYPWAGELRTCEIAKGGNQFQLRSYIETGMADVHQRIVKSDFLKNLTENDFSKAAGRIMGDVNYVHPFREGNGRTQVQYLKQLGEQAGHVLNICAIDKGAWIEASQRSHDGEYGPMANEIARIIVGREPLKTSSERDNFAEEIKRALNERGLDRESDLER